MSNSAFTQSGGGGNSNQEQLWIFKTADETVNNSTTPQEDDGLILSLGANEVWSFQLILLITSNSTADFKAGGWTVPTGTTIKWTNYYDNVTTSESGTYFVTTQTNSMAAFYGTIFMGSTGGNVIFKWAQNTQTVVDTKVLRGSYIIAQRLV